MGGTEIVGSTGLGGGRGRRKGDKDEHEQLLRENVDKDGYQP